jgi:hypothetical protein
MTSREKREYHQYKRGGVNIIAKQKNNSEKEKGILRTSQTFHD